MTLVIAEAEYEPQANTIKEASFLHVCSFISPGLGSACITVLKDKKMEWHLDHTPACASNSKYLHTRHHFLRELVLWGEIDIGAVEFELRHADILTKAQAGKKKSLSQGFYSEHLLLENGETYDDLIR